MTVDPEFNFYHDRRLLGVPPPSDANFGRFVLCEPSNKKLRVESTRLVLFTSLSKANTLHGKK